MHNNHEVENTTLREQCLALEGQVKLLVKTELYLRKTQEELLQSKGKIEEYNRTLEQKVQERTQELLQSNEKLKMEMIEREKTEKEKRKLEDSLKRAEKLEALGILAGSVAHDLNNILNGITGYPELMLLKIPPESPLRPWACAIKECGEKAAAVVQDVLLMARQGVIIQDILDVNTIVIGVINSPEFQKIKNDHPSFLLIKKLDPVVSKIVGSAIHIHTAIVNIMLNAVQAMSPDGQLCISTENIFFDTPQEKYERIEAGQYVSIRISDTGSGIAKKDLNKIFEPFYTKKHMGKSGTGLGLAIVWGTIKDHKGFIDVESEVAAGTTITLYLPATQKTAKEKRTESKRGDYTGNNETILIVDDIEIQRSVCTEILNSLGYSVESVSSGEKAIEYVKSRKVDLLVLDMIMDPGINGLETYKRILEIHPDQKAIVTSGYSQTNLITEILALGAGPFLMKPFSIEQIGWAIKKKLHDKN